MIATDYTGRLGNQLFTYAFTRSLIAHRNDIDDELVANFKRSSAGKAEEGFEDSLRFFNVLPYKNESTTDLVLSYGSLWQRLLYLFYMLCCRLPLLGHSDNLMTVIERRLDHFGLFFTGAADAARPLPKLSQKNIFIRGYFADRTYFDNIRSLLLEELTPKESPLPHNQALYIAAAHKNSVCVSVRRGDYLSVEYKKNFYVCDENYFHRAISKIRDLVENPVFIFFSNDIDWVRSHLHVDNVPCYYESGTDPSWEVLRLMYSCHHFIISNSTFSWWAQYLGRHDDKIVISPHRWFANPQWHSNLIDDSFIKI